MMTENNSKIKIILTSVVIFQIILMIIGGLLLQKINKDKLGSTNLLYAKKEDLIAEEKNLLSLSAELNKTIDKEKTRYLNLKDDLAGYSQGKNTSSTDAALADNIKIPDAPAPIQVINPPVITRAS
jgi:hypothetical protein